MTDWDERFATGSYPRAPEPSSVLQAHLPSIPDGRALDVATGTGRNAVYLAAAGYDVDALDASREGLDITRERAREQACADRLTPIQGDVNTYEFPEGTYELITISFFRAIDRFPDIKAALVPGGYLFVEHHLRSTEELSSGPSGDRYRFAANELLHAGLDFTVLHYDEATEERPDDRRRASARLLARRSHGQRQSYPPRIV